MMRLAFGLRTFVTVLPNDAILTCTQDPAAINILMV